jgi:hypothetical protein
MIYMFERLLLWCCREKSLIDFELTRSIFLLDLYLGFAHVDRQRRVSGVSSDYRCSIGSPTQDDSVSFSNVHYYCIDTIVLIVPSFIFFFPYKMLLQLFFFLT